MNHEITFDKAKIAGIEHRISLAGSVTSRIKIVAIATAKVARAIGARWLLDKDALVKSGFTSVDLDYEIKSVRARHEIEKVNAFETTSELAYKFRLFRKGDDKKKARRLMVSFVIEHNGSPFEILEHLMKVGGGEGICTLEPLQSEMFTEPQKEAKPKRVPKQGRLKTHVKLTGLDGETLVEGSLEDLKRAAAKVDRKASARRERKNKAEREAHPFLSERGFQPSQEAATISPVHEARADEILGAKEADGDVAW